ncbi:MAG: hypothetical protein ACD_73C00392G0002 [uncultured bacterium]|nr:MAG: hypothetical protein ACD_73C00392G0002 [uncultured bacterium]
MKRWIPLITVLLIFVVATTSIAKQKASKPADRAIAHNNEGVTALYNGDTDRALFEFKTATELSPEYAEGWNNLGLAYKYKGQMDLAIQALEKAIDLDSKYASPYNHLGAVYYNLGRYSDALELFKKSIKYNNKFSDAYYNMGLTYVAMADNGDTSKLDMAVEALSTATTLNAEHPYAHHELAKIYQRQGKIEQAIIRYKLALEINPNLKDAWVNLASLYNKTGETLKAQQALNQTMKNVPDDPDSHMQIGLSYLNEKNYPLALKEFDYVISKMPTNDMAYFNVGFVHYNMGITSKNAGQSGRASDEFDLAIKAYQSALTLKPNFTDAAYNIAYAYQAKGDNNKAIEWYQKTLGLDPNYSRALYTLGNILIQSGQNQEGLKYLCTLSKSKKNDLGLNPNELSAKIKSLGGCL